MTYNISTHAANTGHSFRSYSNSLWEAQKYCYFCCYYESLPASSLRLSSLGFYRKFQLNASSTFLLINKWINKSSPNLLLIFPGLNNFSSVFCYSWTSPVSKWLSDKHYLSLFSNVITQALVSVIITFQLFYTQYFFTTHCLSLS